MSARIETVCCPACGALLSLRETTDEDILALDPALEGMLRAAPGDALTQELAEMEGCQGVLQFPDSGGFK